MTTSSARALVVLGVVLALAACGQRGGTGSPAPTTTASASAALPADPAALVLRVAATGGFVSPTTTIGRLPLVSVYRDGRVFTEGPVIAVFPAPAWPNVQVGQLDEAAVQELADAALQAGVAETTDLGQPAIADATTTVVTLATAGQTYVREAYALTEGGGDELSAEQQDARRRLSDLVDRATSAGAQTTTAYEPTAVAALAGPYVADPELEARADVPWPGPALPGEPAGPGVGCVVATGEQAAAVTAAARAADTLTPWTTADGRWAVAFRPLLPDETGCADLVG